MTIRDALGIDSGLPAWPHYVFAGLFVVCCGVLRGVARYEAAIGRAAAMGGDDD